MRAFIGVARFAAFGGARRALEVDGCFGGLEIDDGLFQVVSTGLGETNA